MRLSTGPRTVGSVVALVLLLGACGSSSSAPPPGSPYDFDRYEYPGIVYLPLDAYKENRPTRPDEPVGPRSILFQRLFEDTFTDSDTPFLADWNTILGLAENGYGDSRDVMRFFITYQVQTNPSSGACSVTLDIFEGLPFDPDRPSLEFYLGVATIGELDANGEIIDGEASCIEEATRRALDLLFADGHFTEGWSKRPPSHVDS